MTGGDANVENRTHEYGCRQCEDVGCAALFGGANTEQAVAGAYRHGIGFAVDNA